MGRVRSNVVIDDKSFWALFDTGARSTYVIEEVAAQLPTFPLRRAEGVALGGRTHRVDRVCLLSCLVEGLQIETLARVLSEIGTDEDGKRIEVLVGALTMQEWGIVPVPPDERLDMTRYTTQFVEFFEQRTRRVLW